LNSLQKKNKAFGKYMDLSQEAVRNTWPYRIRQILCAVHNVAKSVTVNLTVFNELHKFTRFHARADSDMLPLVKCTFAIVSSAIGVIKQQSIG
jgi:hypothetical protein